VVRVMLKERMTGVMTSTRLFLIAAAVSSLLWLYSVQTTTIDRIELTSVPIVSMYRMMPMTFWMGWGFLILATCAWYFSTKSTPLHFLLGILWFLFLIMGPELMEVNARGGDTLGHMIGVTYYDNGLYEPPWVGYSAFPGFHFLVIPLHKITGVGFFDLAKLVALSFHVIRLPVMLFLGTRLFKDPKPALFFTLLLTALFWEQYQLDPSNQNLGMTFMLLILGLLFVDREMTPERRVVVIVLYVGLVVTHPLSSMVVLVLLLFFRLIGMSGKGIGSNALIRDNTLIALFGVMFGAWLMYSSDWVLPQALDYFKRMVILMDRNTALGTTGSVTTSTGTVTTSFFAALVYSFLALLALWGLAIAVRRRFWNHLSLRRVLPLLCIVPLLVSVLTGFWSLNRYYFLSAPFIAWFFAQEMETRKTLAIVLLIVSLPFGFTLRYYNEPLDYPPSREYIAAQFVVNEIPSTETVVQGIRYGPDFRSMANAVKGPERADFIDVSNATLKPGQDFRYAMFSAWNRNHAVFYAGEELWDVANAYFFEVPSNIIYSNGDNRVHAYEDRRPKGDGH